MGEKILKENEALEFRRQLREARNKALADAEDFHDLLAAIERLGAFLSNGTGLGLGSYRDALLKLVGEEHPGYSVRGKSWLKPGELFDLVKAGRNDALHQGAYARNLTRNAIGLALLLEDALVKVPVQPQARHFMTPNPVCAEFWKPLSMVRRDMLASSFSFLPIRKGSGPWQFVSDRALAAYLQAKASRAGNPAVARRQALDQTVEEAVTDGLSLEAADEVRLESPLEDVITKCARGVPVLVTDGSDLRLLGILTAFDLL